MVTTTELDLQHSPLDDRADARAAVAAMLTKCTQLFPRALTPEQAELNMPFFEHVLVGDRECPHFSAHDIGKGFVDWMSRQKHRTAPMPAEIVDAIGSTRRDRRQATAAPPEPVRRPCCDLCGSEKAEDGSYGQGTLGMYRDAGPGAASPWERDEHACGHSRAWLHGRNAQGWSTLSQLPAHERHVAVGGPELAGPLATLVDRLGDKMGRGRGA